MIIIPIQIRDDVLVQIGNLPIDLTEAEARKIARTVMAYATPVETTALAGSPAPTPDAGQAE